MKTKKSIIVTVLLAVIAIAAFFGIRYLLSVRDYQSAVQNLTYSGVDIEAVPDGVYEGDCDVNFIYAKVSVEVRDGKITDIKLVEHKNERGSTAEVIVDEIVAAQSLDVDVVSQATNSSKVIKKAIDNALSSAVQ
jgi:uncharacterized protein with FMN-binding domain